MNIKLLLGALLLGCGMQLHSVESTAAVTDEAIYNQIRAVLQNNELDDTEKYDEFCSLLFKLENKNINEEQGGVLSLAIAFTHDQLQADLVTISLEHGVMTKRLPGEFLGSRYFPQNAGIGDRLRYEIEQRYEGIQEYAADQVLNATELYYSLKDRIITSEE